MKFKYLLILVVIGALIGGGQALYTAITNPEPAEYTVEEYLKKKPDDIWLKLKDCKTSLVDATYYTYIGVDRINNVFLPIQNPQSKDDGKIHVLIETEDKEVIKYIQEMAAIKSENELVKYITKNIQVLQYNRDFQGLVRFGIDFDSDEEKDLKELNPTLADDFIIIKDGEKPDLQMGIILIFIGLIIGFFVIKPKKNKNEEAGDTKTL